MVSMPRSMSVRWSAAAQLESITEYIDDRSDEGAKARRRRRDRARWRPRQGLFPPADDLRRGRRRYAGRAGRDLRPGDVGHPGPSFDEAIEVANSVQYGLSASIFTANVNRAFRAMQDIYTGILYINAGTIGAEIQLPFGGTKATGNGHREAGTAALDFFTEWQSIYVDYSGKLQRAQIDNQ